MTVLNIDTLGNTPYQVIDPQNQAKQGMNPTVYNHTVNRRGKYAAFDFEHHRYKCRECLVGFTIQQQQAYLPTKILIDASGATTRNAVYLPYLDHFATSVRLSTNRHPAIRYFFTDNLSGCAVYVDKRTGGRFFAYHVNTHVHSSKEETKRKAPSRQHAEATHQLQSMHSVSARDQRLYQNRQNQHVCTKDIYLGAADGLKKKGKKLGLNRRILKKDLLAGTCVLGVRATGGGDNWTFYYQTWGRLDRKGASTDLIVIDSATF